MLRGRSGSSRARGASTSSRGSSPSRGRGRGVSNSFSLGNSSTSDPPNAFEKDRFENAAKREQRGQASEAVTGRGGRGLGRGKVVNKSVRFTSPPTQDPEDTSNGNPTSTGVASTSSAFINSPFGTPSISSIPQPWVNPFATAPNPVAVPRDAGVFGAPAGAVLNKPNSNPFATQQSSDVFASPSGLNPSMLKSNPFANQQSSIVFGAPSGQIATSIFDNSFSSGGHNGTKSNPFSNPSTSGWNSHGTSIPSVPNPTPFGSSSGSNSNPFSSSSVPISNFFAAPATSSSQNTSMLRTNAPVNVLLSSTNTTSHQFYGKEDATETSKPAFGSASSTAPVVPPDSLSRGSATPQGISKQIQPRPSYSQPGVRSPLSATGNSATNLPRNSTGSDIDALLRKNGIIPPSWPTSSPGDPREKGAVEAFWQTTQAYRAKVRSCLIRNGLLDDPDKQKKLSEAIDFRGTCEEMCPEFEKITRIVEHNVQTPEKDLSPDGKSYWPSLPKMVKALARSAAGQDAPLPEDVRSPAALRRTLDYLIDEVLGTSDLPTIHGFLWDRTRAIRRDFVFQQSSMTSQELLDQVYCLEIITRFHVVALHHMSHEDVNEEFSEQQEVEQLGKALLSLIHAYEDCMSLGITCENEAEFRAYYVLLNSKNTGILEAVQDWGWKYWGVSDEIRTAINLVEALQNVWDKQGPLAPYPSTDIAQNGYSRYFSIMKGPRISYTMACFAEIHLNRVRKAALKTILATYRVHRQKQQTNSWSLEKLNMYLNFDDEQDIIRFGEAYGLHFIEDIGGQEFLSLESDDSMKDPFPALKQPYSHDLVERKRGYHTLPEVIRRTVFEETGGEDGGESLFVPVSPTIQLSKSSAKVPSPMSDVFPDMLDDLAVEETPTSALRIYKPSSQQGKGDEGSVKSNGPGAMLPAVTWNHKTAATIKDPEFATSTDLEQKPSKPNSSEKLETNSVFDEKSATPRGSIFSIPGQDKTTFSNGEPLSASPLFPPAETRQTSSTFAPPSLSTTKTAAQYPGTFAITSPSAFAFLNHSSAPSKNDVVSTSEPSNEVIPKPVNPPDNLLAPNAILPSQKIHDPTWDENTINLNRQLSKIEPPETQMPALANWIAAGRGGILDDFTDITVERILQKTVKGYLEEEKRRHQEEEERLSREKAALFRYNSLATKYCHRWREIAHHLWLRRKGRLARDARRKMAQSVRASKVEETRDIVEEFKASRGPQRRSSGRLSPGMQSLTVTDHQEHRLDGLARRNRKSSSELLPGTPNKTSKHGKSPSQDSSEPSSHKQDEPQDLLRRSLLSDSAYLQGGSRIHLIPNHSLSMEGRRQPNGVKTDYFRLKARGIMTLPNGTPLANTAAVHLLPYKRSLDNISRPMTPPQLLRTSLSSSVPAKPVAKEINPRKMIAEQDKDVEALKARARLVMAKDKEKIQSSRKRLLDNDDEELFAKAKRIRDQMDEGADWFRTEIHKSLSRSSS